MHSAIPPPLPTHIRPRSRALHHRVSEDFFTRSTSEDAPAPTVDISIARTRLEVLHGWEVNFTILSLYLSSILALVYVLVKLHASRATWEATAVMPSLSTFERCFRFAMTAASTILAVFFVCNLVLHPSITHEQIWTCVLLLVALAVDNPLIGSSHTTHPSRATLLLNDAVYTAAIYLYLILAAHSYRVFDARNIRSLHFYLPKLLAAVGYLLVKVVAGFWADVSLGLVPYSRLFSWLFLEQSGRRSLRVSVPVLLITALDTAFAFWLVHEVASTSEFLATVPYVEHRAKQLGFRCFVYQTLAFSFSIIGLSVLIAILTPRGFLFKSYDNHNQPLFQLEPPIARLALAFVYFTWVLVLAYVNLPPRPLMMTFAHEVMQRALFLVRNSRIAVWMGLADMVTAEDDEDSSDDDVEGPSTEERPDNRIHEPVMASGPTIPFRYRHRELYDDIALSPNPVHPIAPSFLNHEFPRLNASSAQVAQSYEDLCWNRCSSRHGTREEVPSTANNDWNTQHTPRYTPVLSSRPSPAASSSHQGLSAGTSSFAANVPNPSQSIDVYNSSGCGDFAYSVEPSHSRQSEHKLRRRKNLFVMETQVIMANAMYLSYIPGNLKEERIPLPSRPPRQDRSQGQMLHTGSLASSLDHLAKHIGEENESLAIGLPDSAEEEITPQSDRDDGNMFLVDPYEMAERYGYRIHRHITNEALNTHAIILVSCSRVIVAFSGTRDVKNWGVNANISRVVLDDKLSRFEYELSFNSEPMVQDFSDAEDDDNSEQNDYELHEIRFSRQTSSINQPVKLRKSRSVDDMQLYERTEEQSETPLTRSSSVKHSYGAMNRAAKLYGASSSTRDNNHRGLQTHRGVTRVAKTFARELMTFGQAKVHEGFILAYMSLRKQVMGTLLELYRGRTWHTSNLARSYSDHPTGVAYTLPLFFCGHSLGGALATFGSYEAARYYKRIGLRSRSDISCTTFGCPCIGNEAFKARYERLVEAHWRFELAADPIPKIPVLLNYVHVGVQVLLDQSGMLLIDPSFIEVQWWGRLANLYLGYRLHIRASYCMALRTYCKLYKSGADDLSECFWPFPIRVQTKGLFQLAHR